MSADRAALLRAVLANPADDTARLVFADWLQEHGEEERAAFIRHQFETGPQYSEWPRDGVRMPFHEWHDSAASVFHEDLRVPARRRGFSFRWHRGWIDQVSLAAAVFMDRAERLFETHPVEFVTLADVRPEVDPSVAATVDPMDPADTALAPHIIVCVEDNHPRLLGSQVPAPIWELLEGYTEIDSEPAAWPHKTFPSLAHALEALSRACVRWGRELAELPQWNPPYRLLLEHGKEAKAPPL